MVSNRKQRLLPLVLILFVVIVGFLSVTMSYRTIADTNRTQLRQIHNLTEEMALGMSAVETLHIVVDRYNSSRDSTDPVIVSHSLKETFEAVEQIDETIQVLSTGGTLHKQDFIDTTGENKDLLSITYHPELQIPYNMDLLSLRSQVYELRGMLEQAKDLGVLHDVTIAKDLNSLVDRMLENANSFTIDVRADLNESHREVEGFLIEKTSKEILWATVPLGLVIVLIFMIFRQISRNGLALEHSVAELRVTKDNLQLKNRQISALNETLEERVLERTEELALSEQQWSDAFDAVHDPIFLHDKDGYILKANRAYIEIAEIGIEQVVGQRYWDVFPRQDEAMPGCLERATLSDPSGSLDTNMVLGNKTFRSRAFSVQNAKGEYLYSLHLLEDETEKVLFTQLLREKEQRFRGLFDSAPVAFLALDESGRIIEVNDAWQEMFNALKADVLGQPFLSCIPEAEKEDFLTSFDLLKNTGELRGKTLKIQTAAGAELFVLVEAQCNRNGIGGHLQSHFVLFDVTEKRRLEVALEVERNELKGAKIDLEAINRELKRSQATMLQNEKMASIGQLAAGVAHEINNPMSYINSNLTTLDKYFTRLVEYQNEQQAALSGSCSDEMLKTLSDLYGRLKIGYILEDLKEIIDDSMEGAGRVKRIVQSLKTFSRVDDDECQETDINECLESTIDIVWNEIKYNSELKREFGVLPLIKCYPQQLSQVFMNLIVNASQAIVEGGIIEVKTIARDNSILITISDNGQGIPEENLGRLFDPFYTTKSVGEGTGLGLSIVYEIVQKHHGDISVSSRVGQGTTFSIELPLV